MKKLAIIIASAFVLIAIAPISSIKADGGLDANRSKNARQFHDASDRDYAIKIANLINAAREAIEEQAAKKTEYDCNETDFVVGEIAEALVNRGAAARIDSYCHKDAAAKNGKVPSEIAAVFAAKEAKLIKIDQGSKGVRLIAPIAADASCAACHKGVKEGDILGANDITILRGGAAEPTKKNERVADAVIAAFLSAHIMVVNSGIADIFEKKLVKLSVVRKASFYGSDLNAALFRPDSPSEEIDGLRDFFSGQKKAEWSSVAYKDGTKGYKLIAPMPADNYCVICHVNADYDDVLGVVELEF